MGETQGAGDGEQDPALRDAELERWAEALRAGERRALSRAITLVESTNPSHRARARQLLELIYPHAGGALRLGLTGTPGVGKSTFIESFGQRLIAAGKRVAVLAVDPSSARSGGSILGDKTRMERLSRDPAAFIRPSPSQSALGGVARRTREAILLCEAAGYDVVIVETVGVGQSETMVADMTDVFVLLIAPAGGDELQGVKRGVMEMADLIVVNKADGALESTARATVSDYANALRLFRKRPGDPEDVPTVLPASAATGGGLDALQEKLFGLDAWRRAEGWRDRRRREQDVRWMRFELERGLTAAFDADPGVAAALPELTRQVQAGEISPEGAADQALRLFLERKA